MRPKISRYASNRLSSAAVVSMVMRDGWQHSWRVVLSVMRAAAW